MKQIVRLLVTWWRNDHIARYTPSQETQKALEHEDDRRALRERQARLQRRLDEEIEVMRGGDG